MPIEEVIAKLQKLAKENPGIAVTISTSEGSATIEDAVDVETIEFIEGDEENEEMVLITGF